MRFWILDCGGRVAGCEIQVAGFSIADFLNSILDWKGGEQRDSIAGCGFRIADCEEAEGIEDGAEGMG